MNKLNILHLVIITHSKGIVALLSINQQYLFEWTLFHFYCYEYNRELAINPVKPRDIGWQRILMLLLTKH